MPTDSVPSYSKVLEALIAVVRDPGQVLEVLYASETPSAGQSALQERFGWDEFQARAVLNMQFKKVTRSERDGFGREREQPGTE